MSSLGQYYSKFYNQICGKHPHQLFWHFQWLSAKNIRSSLKAAINRHVKSGMLVYDVGCGTSPYKQFLPPTCSYLGLDIDRAGTSPDIIVSPNFPWPIQDDSCDFILCNEVIEHVEDLDFFLSQINRVLKKSGKIIITVPFSYNAHGLPYDFRRFSIQGISQILSKDYHILELDGVGRAGTVLVSFLLNWIDSSLNISKIGRYLKPFLLPIWLPFCIGMNLLGLIIDNIDRTNEFYQETICVAIKKA
jgi:SAM-dependent methyltransferase